jgi:hypothetical protein
MPKAKAKSTTNPFKPLDPFDGTLARTLTVGEPGVVIGEIVQVSVARVKGKKVTLVIQAPKAVTVRPAKPKREAPGLRP